MSPGSDNAWHHQPLPWLVLASLALHAGLLAWQAPSRSELPALSSRSGSLSVQLTAGQTAGEQQTDNTQTPAAATADRPQADAGPAAADHHAEAVPDRSAPPAASSRSHSAAETFAASGHKQKEPASETVTESVEPVAESAPKARQAGSRRSQAGSIPASTENRSTAVLNEVRDALQQHFFYPRLARLRNWEGDVLLGFQVRSDGRIHEVEVLESSGRAVLDQAALSALRSVRQVAYNATRPVDLQLPVAYRLH